jgi:GGDEF domain-containing protein
MHATSKPRPVAEASVDGLLDRADELARRWVIALILARPLNRIGELPLDDLGREAPALCAQVIRALLSEAELERMAGSGAAGSREESASARKLAELAGAGDAASAVRAVEALREVVWEALLEELRDPSARQVADLADRLAYVCATALTATIVTVAAERAATVADPAASGQGGLDGASPGPRGPVLVDERDEMPVARPAGAAPTSEHADPEPAQVQPFPWELAPFASPEPSRTAEAPISRYPGDAAAAGGARSEARAGGFTRRARAEPEIEIRDERGEDGPAAWIGSIGSQLEQFRQDGLPFAVLLVDLFDLERLSHVALPEESSAVTREIEAALAPVGSLTRERAGRYWLLAPETDGLAARMLAERLVRSLRAVVRRRGMALPFAVGMAVCPEDGRDAAVLAAHADVGACDARSAGRSIALATPAEDLDLSG